MELRHLRSFIAVAEDLSFTQAAARVHVAQPALSVQVRQLEEEIGVTLFDRSRRAIRLTDAGVVLLAEARRLLAGLEQGVDLVRRTGTGAVGRLTIGFVPSASNGALPPMLRRFGTSHPDVALDLREMAPDALVRELHEHRIDLALLYLPFADTSLATAVVARESFVVALPEDHPLAARARIDVARLRDEPFVLPARHGMPGLRAQVLDICREAGFTPGAVQDDVWLVQTIVGLVAAGIGVALIPASAQAQQRRGVSYRPLRHRTAHAAELAAVWRVDDTSAVLRAFLAQVPSPHGADGTRRGGDGAPAGRRRGAP